MEVNSFSPGMYRTPPFYSHEESEIVPSTSNSETITGTDTVVSHKPEQSAFSPLQDLPVLPRPRASLSFRLMKLCDSGYSLAETGMQYQIDRLEEIAKEKRSIQEALVKKIQEAAEKAASSKGWTTFTKVGSILGSIFSIGIGITAVASGAATPAGIVMIAAGGAMLTNEIATELKAWDNLATKLANGNKVEKERILKKIEFWISGGTLLINITSIILGTAVIGGGLEVAQATLKGGSSVIQGIGSFGKTQNEKHRLLLESEKEFLNNKTFIASELEEQTNELLAAAMKDREELGKKIAHMLALESEQARIIANILK